MTLDQAETRPIEEKIAAIESWIVSMDESRQVSDLDPTLVRDVLTHFGADFNALIESGAVLNEATYGTKSKRPGIEAIWGTKYGQYRDWAKKYVDDYEARTGKTLPSINIIKDGVKTGSTKISGMTQIFSEFTEYAASTLSFETFKLHTEVRLHNGFEKSEGRNDNLRSVDVPSLVRPGELISRKISSVPPGFARDMFDYLKTLNK